MQKSGFLWKKSTHFAGNRCRTYSSRLGRSEHDWRGATDPRGPCGGANCGTYRGKSATGEDEGSCSDRRATILQRWRRGHVAPVVRSNPLRRGRDFKCFSLKCQVDRIFFSFLQEFLIKLSFFKVKFYIRLFIRCHNCVLFQKRVYL